MKYNIHISIIIGFILSCLNIASLYAQEEKLPSYFSDKENKSQLLMNISQMTEGKNSSLKGTLSNEAYTSSIVLNQIGSENLINVKNAQNGTQEITQLGNKNYYGFVNYFNDTSFNLGVLQQGDSNSLEILGTNSLINNMQIQQTKGASITITNY